MILISLKNNNFLTKKLSKFKDLAQKGFLALFFSQFSKFIQIFELHNSLFYHLIQLFLSEFENIFFNLKNNLIESNFFEFELNYSNRFEYFIQN